MNTVRFSRVRRWIALALLLALLSTVVMAGASPSAGSGQARWAALGYGGITPNGVARPDDPSVAAFSSSGSIGPNCYDPNNDVTYTPGDALLFFARFSCWHVWFDATGSGLNANVDINALDDGCDPTDPGCDIYLSFKSRTNIAGVGQVKPQDVVSASWNGMSDDVYNNWAMYLDGSDVGLTTTGESIDALYRFDATPSGPYPGPSAVGTEASRPVCEQLLLISTAGAYRVPDQWGNNMNGGGEDVLGFCASWLGWDTAGYWFLYHDGSAEGLPPNSLIGLNHEDGRKAYSRFDFLTKGNFAADSARGGHSEIFRFSGQTGAYSGPTFSYPDHAGTTDKVDSFDLFYTE